MSAPVPWQSTLVRADDRVPGRWHATIDEIWVATIVPLGGLSAAVAARAMTAELLARGESVETQRLRSIHCLFAAPVPAGPVEATVTVLRAGRSMSQVQATVRGPTADAGLTALGAFGAPRLGYRFDALAPPDVPPPDACPLFRDPPPPDVDWDPGRRMPLFYTVIDGRPAMGLPPWDRTPRTTAEMATWYRFDDQPFGEDGRPDPLSLLVLSDLMLGSLGQRIGYSQQPWICPSVDLTVHLFEAPGPGWILSHNKARLAGDGYASLECALWNPSGDDGARLVAHASQQVFFSFPDGAPPPDTLRL